MNKCIKLELTNESALSSQDEQPKSPTGTGITITQPSPGHARKRSLPQDDPIIDHKKSSSKPITATSSFSRKRQCSRKEAKVRFASAPHQTHVVPRWTEDEYRSWYSKLDLFAFRYQESIDAAVLRTCIQATNAIENLPQEPALYRGLERSLSPMISSEISERRKRCVMSVLVAQHIGLNMDQIAQVSKNSSDQSVEWALTLGSV